MKRLLEADFTEFWLNRAKSCRKSEETNDNRLIKQTDSDSPSGVASPRAKTYKPRAREAILSVVSIMAIISPIMPVGVDAFWPFPSGATGGGKRENIQTMNLPLPTMTGNDYSSIGGGSLEIVDGTALMPQEGPSGTPLEIEENAKSGTISTYVVRPGDNLSSIADMFDVTVNTIMWANDIPNAKGIKPGQTLVILPVTGIRYTVKKGGSLRDIVKKYGGDLEEASRYNGIDPDEQLAEGTIVIVPDGEMEAPKPAAPRSSGARIVQSAGGPAYVGYYSHPIPSGARRTQGLHGYNGVDLGAPTGTPVVASAAGTVIISRQGGWNGGYGNYVVIAHGNGTQTLYAHLSSNTVQTGDSVLQGQMVGYVGSTGRSTGAHLHFEVRGAKNPF